MNDKFPLTDDQQFLHVWPSSDIKRRTRTLNIRCKRRRVDNGTGGRFPSILLMMTMWVGYANDRPTWWWWWYTRRKYWVWRSSARGEHRIESPLSLTYKYIEGLVVHPSHPSTYDDDKRPNRLIEIFCANWTRPKEDVYLIWPLIYIECVSFYYSFPDNASLGEEWGDIARRNWRTRVESLSLTDL